MVGWLTWEGERKRRVEAWRESLMGVPVIRVGIPAPPGLRERALLRRVRRGVKLLERAGVRRVLTGPDFPCWEELAQGGLRPVEVSPLCQDLAAPLVLAALAQRGIAPAGTVAGLAGEGVSHAMIRAAEALCPRVRALVIAAPGGEELARYLRWEYGVPVLEPGARVRPGATACFSPGAWQEGETVLRLWGARPDLAGLGLALPGAPAGVEQDALAALLWEQGRLEESKIEICTSQAGINSLDRGG